MTGDDFLLTYFNQACGFCMRVISCIELSAPKLLGVMAASAVPRSYR